jgi:hypothetical protein
MFGRSWNSAYSIAAATSYRSPTALSKAPSLVPRTLLVPLVLNLSTATPARAGSRHAALRKTWLSIIPPCVGSGCRQTSVATGGRSSGTASSPTSVRPSAVSSSMSSRRAGSTLLARIGLLTAPSLPISRCVPRPLHPRPAPVPCPPAAGVPMPPVGRVATPVGRPGHDVGDARADVLYAARAAVRLGGRPAEDRPDHPIAVLILLDALDTLADPLVGQRRDVFRRALRTISARAHGYQEYFRELSSRS